MARVGRRIAWGALVAGAAIVLAAGPGLAAAISRYDVPAPDAHPIAITVGSDLHLWFVENNNHGVGRIGTTGEITEYSTGTKSPIDIAAGPDGNLWVTEAQYSIGRITTSGVVTQFPLRERPLGIAAGIDGNLWFTIPGRQYLRRITPSGALSKYNLPLPVGFPQYITSGPDGALWFTVRSPDKIGRIDPFTGVVTEYPLSVATNPHGIASGPDGKVWFAADHAVGSITPDGQLTEYPIPQSVYASGVAAGPDGAVWFTLSTGLGRMDPARPGQMGRIPVADGDPVGITAGPDGRMWFTANFANWIGALSR